MYVYVCPKFFHINAFRGFTKSYKQYSFRSNFQAFENTECHVIQ